MSNNSSTSTLIQTFYVKDTYLTAVFFANELAYSKGHEAEITVVEGGHRLDSDNKYILFFKPIS
jgi:hypothetical protein